MADIVKDTDRRPPVRVPVFKAVDNYDPEGFSRGATIGEGVDDHGEKTGVTFVKLPINARQELVGDEDVFKAVKIIVQKKGFSKGVFNIDDDVKKRMDYVDGACLRLTEAGDPEKGTQVFKLGAEMLLEHYKEEKERDVVRERLAEYKSMLPSGQSEPEWFKSVIEESGD